jgi:hypothetical protein
MDNKQIAVQVMAKNIRGALKVWAEGRNGNFLDVFDASMTRQKQHKEQKEREKLNAYQS